MSKYIICCFLFSMFACSTAKLPIVKFQQYTFTVDYSHEEGMSTFEISNPLLCTKRVTLFLEDSINRDSLIVLGPILLPPTSDTTIKKATIKKKKVKIRSTLGDPNATVNLEDLALPIMPNVKVRIIQAYNGAYSHTSDYSKYAIDFELAKGDTICSAADGVVVGVIEGYKDGGGNKKWRPYANYLTIYHPQYNVFTQYVHLDFEGALVNIGDSVKKHQKIAISGLTGFTDMEHLHFNVLQADKVKNMISIPINFEGSYDGLTLKKNDIVAREVN